jgi:nucleoside-diphosphate-sugar epimerase
VIPALIRKFVDARRTGKQSITAWGSGGVSREFLYVEDAAEAIVAAVERYDKPDPINVGSGKEITICELAGLIGELTLFSGTVTWDSSQPDGQPRRRLDTRRAEREFGFKAKTTLREGLRRTIDWYEAVSSEHRLRRPA